MQTVSTVAELRAAVKQAKQHGKTVGFVPTMGNLHQGHISLVEAAHAHADYIIASIFVNPMQFGANEDLDAYPRTLADDQAKLSAANTDLLFAPTVSEMYPHGLGSQTVVAVPQLSNRLCGQSRPGHFEGVATVVSKLFNLVQPDVAVFGQKDFQQVMVIEQMVQDLNMPIDIIAVPTARTESGLALSSRNGYLNQEQLTIASGLYQELQECRYGILNSNVDLDSLCNFSAKRIEQLGMQVDYFEICHRRGLQPATHRSDDLVILAAVYLGNTRLIDNLIVEPEH